MDRKDLIARARSFATEVHARIDQRRKYTSQPVEVHLKAVAGTVASVTDDPEAIAAAWLHDTVEDTPATLDDVEREFGAAVRELVEELTDVSRPADGNRRARKELDRRHLAGASARAQTIKLADVIDNCDDICKHDERFGRVYLEEMRELLEVLVQGDEQLRARATRLHAKWTQKLGAPEESLDVERDQLSAFDRRLLASGSLQRFAGVFSAADIAEPLRSFDRSRTLAEVSAILDEDGLPVAGVRCKGRVVGYLSAEAARAGTGTCGDAEREFKRTQLLDGAAPLSSVVQALTLHEACFVCVLGGIHGLITRADIQKPMVRMWLFGIITFIEMRLDDRVRERWPDGGWTAHLSKGRLDKARRLYEERLRRGDTCELVDCLQFADRAQILFEDATQREAFDFPSKSAAARVVKEAESLRNKLAHAQDIVTHDWAPIARLARRLELWGD
ncbi:MAG: HD domain-containing protein [bacterium]|nr:HD domain-containing protein [bacterium]